MARGNFGVDAPGLVRGFLAGGVLLGIAGLALQRWAGSMAWARWLAVVLFFMAAYALFMVAYMLWGSLVVKVRDRDAILNLVQWTGEEQVLDVGCGRGLLLVAAARRSTSGNAVGIDLWVQSDQAGNSPAATLENATREGVQNRVRVETGDMRALPFEDASFHVVMSGWAVHNLAARHDRETAIREMIRVLKAGGTILLNDIVHREEYQAYLVRCGWADVRVVVPSRWRDAFAKAVSFGTFQPATIAARAPGNQR